MKRLVLLLAPLALALAGCGSDNRASIEILGRAVPSDLAACTFTAGGLDNLSPTGVYDVNLGGQYGLALYVQNNLADPKTLGADTSSAKAWTVEAVRVRVNPSDYVSRYQPSPALASISGESVVPVASSASLAPAGGSGTVVVGLLADGLATALQSGAGVGGQIVLGVTLLGRTGDGASLDTAEWPFPLQICAGCLGTPTCPTGQTAVPNACLGNGQIGAPTCQ